MAFDTYLLDEAIRDRHERLERQRRQTLTAVLRLLDELGPLYRFERAYVFGSLVEPGRFYEGSECSKVFG